MGFFIGKFLLVILMASVLYLTLVKVTFKKEDKKDNTEENIKKENWEDF